MGEGVVNMSLDENDFLMYVLKHSNVGQKIELQNTNISILYYSSPMYFVLPNNSESEEILVEIEQSQVAQFIGQERLNIFLKKLEDKRESVIIFQTPFLRDVTISGEIVEILNPITKEGLVKVIRVINISKSKSNNWTRGHILFKGDNKSYLQINEGLRGRIAEGLKPYIHTNIFSYLTQEVSLQFACDGEKHFAIIECEMCGKIEIYHVFEIANRLCSDKHCRICSKSKYNNLIDVPFSNTLLIDLFTEFKVFFNEYMHKGKTPPDSMIEKLLKCSKLDHQLEIGVFYEYLSSIYKERFQKANYSIMENLEKVISVAESNQVRFKEFLEYDENFSTIQSLQTTTDIGIVYDNIFNKKKSQVQDFYYPNPVTSVESDDFFDVSEIDDSDFNAIINLYKDTFDLIGDHWFVSNLAKVVKNAPIIDECITPDLYGANLVSKTLRYTKKTDLHDMINDAYNVKIRNAIAHPGRVIDKTTNTISIYDKGVLIDSFKITDFLLEVEKLIVFHAELTDVKYRLAMKKDAEFLMTGGILSLQPDFFTMPDENEKPHLIINQLTQFKKYRSEDINFWVNNINIDVAGNSEGISFNLDRSKSKFFETPACRESIYGITDYVKEWIELVLKEKEIVITHRYCHIPIDIAAGEKDLQWIPIKIPIYPLEDEHEVFIKSMSSCGKIILTSDLEKQLSTIIS